MARRGRSALGAAEKTAGRTFGWGRFVREDLRNALSVAQPGIALGAQPLGPFSDARKRAKKSAAPGATKITFKREIL